MERLGYDAFLIADHITNPLPAVPMLAAAAAVTSTIRIGCTVFANDFKHPVVLAKETAALDLLSDGRFEFGIGAGWLQDEYERAGIPFDPPGVRISRMEEGLEVIRGLWADGSFSFAGDYYTVTDLDGSPKPVQKPGPPIFIGGTGKRMLRVAGREADIVGLLPKTLPYGGHDWASSTIASLEERLSWVREGAGERFDRIELALIAFKMVATDDREQTAAELAARFKVTPEHLLAAPDFLLGSVQQIVERLNDLRDRFGISYITVTEADAEAFATVIERVRG
jgi:probable F420-dependent oxidoreductase